MKETFSQILSQLRREKGVSQRVAAEDLGISQALLSHYENGIREPGLEFVVKACDYYKVSADYLLGRTQDRDGVIAAQGLTGGQSGQNGRSAAGSELKKPILSALVMIFDLLEKTEDLAVFRGAAQYLSTCIYLLFQQLRQAAPEGRDRYPTSTQVQIGLAEAEAQFCRCQYAMSLQAHALQRRPMPPLTGESLSRDYPRAYPALLDILQETEKRLSGRLSEPAPPRRRRGARVE